MKGPTNRPRHRCRHRSENPILTYANRILILTTTSESTSSLINISDGPSLVDLSNDIYFKFTESFEK